MTGYASASDSRNVELERALAKPVVLAEELVHAAVRARALVAGLGVFAVGERAEPLVARERLPAGRKIPVLRVPGRVSMSNLSLRRVWSTTHSPVSGPVDRNLGCGDRQFASPVAPLDDGTAPQSGRAACAARSSVSTAAPSRGWSAWTLATDGSNLGSYARL